jgi:cytochrome c
MPNRNGMTTDHAMWPGKEFGKGVKPDTKNVACMKDCVPEAKVSSFLPDYARNAHGNLAEQNRLVGAQHGVDTTRPESSKPATSAPAGTAPAKVDAKPAAKADGGGNKAAIALTQKNSCTACHAMDKKLVGPSFQEIAKKHAGKVDYLAGKIKSGGSGVWGPVPMPAQSLSDADAKTIAVWLSSGAGK